MKKFEFKEIKDDEKFDPGSVCEEAPFTQANFYGDWQKSLGKKSRRFLVYCNSEIVAYFQLIKYPLLFGKSCFYIPYGPITKDFSKEFLADLKKELTKISKTERVVFVRLDFTPKVPNERLSRFFKKAPLYTHHSAYFQPRLEWFLGLKESEEDLLKNMHGKTRYAIRLAQRKEIKAEIITQDFEKYFEVFYTLMSGTAKRNGFSLHEKEYYKNIFENLSTNKDNYLAIASYGQKILAIYLIIISGKTANYVFGGSSDEERNRMPTYLAHWEAICHAKRLDCDYYNFGGIEEKENLLNEKMLTLTTYKKKFGGIEIRHSDFFDVIVSPFWYHLYNFRKFIKTVKI